MADKYRVNHPKGIVMSDSRDEDDYEEGDVWEDPPEFVLRAFGDRLDPVEEVEEEEAEEDEEEEDEEEEDEGFPEAPTEAELADLDRNELRSQYAAHIEEVNGNASAEEIREQVLEFYAEE